MTSSLFTWQRAVIAAGLPEALSLTALRIGLDSNQATGRAVVINDAAVATDVGCSARTVWRRVQSLVEAGWLVQTSKPTYAGAESRGRRARYELQIPGQSPDTGTRDVSDDHPGVDGHTTADDDTRLGESSDNTPRDLSDDNPSRLTKRPQSSATPPPDVARFLASGGLSTAAAAAARELPVDVEILRRALEAHKFVVRWSILTDAEVAEIQELIAAHGDGPLIQSAIRDYQPNRPAATARAWLPSWRELRAPGDLAAVRNRHCPTHGTALSPSGACTSCAADQKAKRTS